MRCDILIAGAGCSGLSLAVHLLDAGVTDLDILLVDPRETHLRDRTWCYWPVERHPFEAAVSHSWYRWLVRTNEGDVARGSPALGYRCLPSDSFYEMALERLSRAPNVTLQRGVSVEEYRPADPGLIATTSTGDIETRHVFDSRPPRPGPARAGEIDWLQHFVGLEVRTEHPVFDPSVATLMDFRVAAGDEIRFMYVLPFSENHALVEDTFFGGEPMEDSVHEEAIGAYLADRLGAGTWTEIHRERGAIPMRTELPRRPASSRVTNIGVRAGRARPSTGYAFLAIQRQSAELAALVSRSGIDRLPAGSPAYGLAASFLDRVFMAYLEREPRVAPALFRSMFARVAPDRLARFMYDGGTVSDRAAVMRALPAAPLVRQALRSGRPALRDLLRRNR